MSAIYILWLRELKRYTRSRVQIAGFAGAAVAVSAGVGIWIGAGVSARGQGSYLQFVAPGVIGMTVLFSSIFSGLGMLVGQAVRIFERDAGGAGAAVADHDWAHAGRSDGGGAAGVAGDGGVRDCRLQACAPRHGRWRWVSCC
jgi:hypothetical protein